MGTQLKKYIFEYKYDTVFDARKYHGRWSDFPIKT